MTTQGDRLRMTRAGNDGRHPQHPHLIYAEFDSHHGAALLKVPGHGSALVGWDDVAIMLGDQYDECAGDQFGYITDEYLDILDPED